MKNKYPIDIIDPKFQVHHNKPKKIQLHQEYRGATNNEGLFMIMIRHRKIKMISDGYKITEFSLI